MYLAKLDEDTVRRIRRDSRPVKVVAEELGVSLSSIYNVRSRKIWAWVQDEAV